MGVRQTRLLKGIREVSLVRACTSALAAAIFFLPSGSNARAASGCIVDVRPDAGPPAPAFHLLAEHRYRIVAQLRVAFFWIGRDDVGSARLTSRTDGTTTALTLLVGSDPARAPRKLNQWGYLREEVRASDHADVFSVRSLDKGAATSPDGFGVGDGPIFGASCSAVNDGSVASARTTVNARGLTYRMFDQLLDRVAVSPDWAARRTRRPAGADAGFLTALQHTLEEVRDAGARSTEASQTRSYVYNDTIYDLSTRDSQPLGRTTVGARTFDRLVRADLSIRNRTTSDVTRFGVTFSPDLAATSLPVQIFYQPSFWLRIELRLDDAADVPADPAGDGSVLSRIRAICGSVSR
jgi:hypothetical protein